MGKTGRWIKSFLTGKKEKKNNDNENTSINEPPTTPISTTPKEKKRWSFRRSSATVPHKDLSATDITLPVAAAAAAEAVIQLTASARTDEAAAAVKIQAVFRGYLSRKALNALKGLVKLQALVRGHLVRKQAAATLKCMQALVTAQARARAQRITMTQQGNPRQSVHRKSTHTYQDYEEEDIKIVEMDRGDQSTKSRNSYSNRGQSPKHISPAPSAIADQSPRAYSGHFEEYNAYGTAQSSPQYYSSAISKPDPSYARSEYAESLYNEYVLYPSYMANTESSRAKVRSHSAPKQRPDQSSFERQPSSRRRPSIEGRNVPRAVRMQRSSSHVGSTAQNYHYPCSIKLDKSNISECGSNCSILTARRITAHHLLALMYREKATNCISQQRNLYIGKSIITGVKHVK